MLLFSKSTMDNSTLYLCVFIFSPDESDLYLCYRAIMNEIWELPLTADLFFIYFAMEGEQNSFGEFIYLF